MINNTRFIEVDEELIRILNLLANFVEVDQITNYNFHVENHSFTLNKVKAKNRKVSKVVLELLEPHFDLPTQVILLLIFSIFAITLVGLEYKNNPVPQEYRVIAWNIFAALFIILVIIFLGAIVSKIYHSFKINSKKEIKKAIKNIVIEQSLVKEICGIAQSNRKVIKLTILVINNLIEKAEGSQKRITDFLPLLSIFVAGLYVVFVLPSQWLENTTLLILIAVSTLVVSPIIKYWEQSQTQSLITKLKECLLLVEVAHIILDEEFMLEEQVVEQVKSTKLHPKFGSAKGLINTSDNFNEPIADFDEEL